MQQKEKKASSFYHSNGMGMKQCRQLCEFYFGEFFFEAKMNRADHVVYIYLFKKIRDTATGKVLLLDSTIDVPYFYEFWCEDTKQWKIKIIDQQDVI